MNKVLFMCHKENMELRNKGIELIHVRHRDEWMKKKEPYHTCHRPAFPKWWVATRYWVQNAGSPKYLYLISYIKFHNNV